MYVCLKFFLCSLKLLMSISIWLIGRLTVSENMIDIYDLGRNRVILLYRARG